MKIMNMNNKNKMSIKYIILYLITCYYKTLGTFFIDFIKTKLLNKKTSQEAKKILDAKSIIKMSFKLDENNEIFTELLERHKCDFKILNMNNIENNHVSELNKPIEISPEIYFVLYQGELKTNENENKNKNTETQVENKNIELVDLNLYIEKKQLYGIVYSYTKTLSELLKFLKEKYKKESKQINKTIISTRYCNVYRLTGFTEKTTPIVDRKQIKLNKTFNNIFLDYENKTKLHSNITNFLDDKYYSVRGIPQNLGILLYGIPGCGKTSFIKALSNHLERDIVIIDFKLIKKVKELYSIFNKVFKSDGDYTYNINVENTIFVFEDFDCMSDVFKKREKETTEIDKIKDIHKILNEDESYDSDETNETDSKKSKKSNKSKNWKDYFKKLECDITLNNFLELFDGVIEMEKRVVVMTTNKFESIDEALIRPGRIDLVLEFRAPDKMMIYNIFYFMYQQHPRELLDSLLLKYNNYFDKFTNKIGTSYIFKCFMQRDPEKGIIDVLYLSYPNNEISYKHNEISYKHNDINKEINHSEGESDSVIIKLNKYIQYINSIKLDDKVQRYLLDITKVYTSNVKKDKKIMIYSHSTGMHTFGIHSRTKFKIYKIINDKNEDLISNIDIRYTINNGKYKIDGYSINNFFNNRDMLVDIYIDNPEYS